ncbi:unnamed protein product [Microthlaspi erraticum]|uniref:At2g29880-like C-terminal domain-containing protein n=1 Tax=Microthlaspi erraticum TaxID=1685480 RepID=A0A6D2HGA9_9BRAS|nr:unnamed protein product [Microthlaspi erraticum]
MFTASDEVWNGYFKAHPNHKYMRYDSHDQFEDMKIIFDGTAATGSNAIGLGDSTDACTYRVGDNQVNDNLISCDSGDELSDASPISDKHRRGRAEKLVARKRSKKEACNNSEEQKSDNNDYVVTVSNKILGIIQQREKRQQKEAEKREAEKKKNSVWDAMKGITNLDQRAKFKAVTLIYSLGMNDVFADMSVEERYGWIQTNISLE